MSANLSVALSGCSESRPLENSPSCSVQAAAKFSFFPRNNYPPYISVNEHVFLPHQDSSIVGWLTAVRSVKSANPFESKMVSHPVNLLMSPHVQPCFVLVLVFLFKRDRGIYLVHFEI